MSVRIEHKTKKEDFERRGGGRKGMRKAKEKITDCSMKPGNRMTGREAEHSRSGRGQRKTVEKKIEYKVY